MYFEHGGAFHYHTRLDLKSCDRAVIFLTAWRSYALPQVNDVRCVVRSSSQTDTQLKKLVSSCKSFALNINMSRVPAVRRPVVYEGDVLLCSSGWVRAWVTGAGLGYLLHLIHGYYQESYFLKAAQLQMVMKHHMVIMFLFR